MKRDIKKLVSEMTLEEKAGLCSGRDSWRTKAVERLGIPSVMMSDGPHGLRKQADAADCMGLNKSIDAVCFPAGCATTASFDRDLMEHMGDTIGNECQAENLAIVLGPAMNIKRSPLCGRNFEYMSEDPYLAGEMAASYINGVQKHHVGTSAKHFALNNQEHERMSCSSECDERTMREIYLSAFETAVKKAQPYSIMHSYNRVNGTFAGENKTLLTDILRKEWGFKGFVVSDWGAVDDRVKGVAAGEDLEMPGGNPDNDKLIVEAVKNGTLSEKDLDAAVERILNVVFEAYDNREDGAVFDRDKDHDISEEIAENCMVLLKNEGGILPLDAKKKGILFVGGFARHPRYQGGGSSHINSHRVEDGLTSARALAEVDYAEGFPYDADVYDEKKAQEAIEKAKNASSVVIFAGLPDTFESEGYDRKHMQLPACQNRLIEEIAAVNPNVVVVLHNGSPVEMPWVDKVPAVLEAYLGGEGSGRAVARILFGLVNPSGHLAETFPIRLEDNPSYLTFGGKGGKVYYSEGVFVGYRWYDAKKMNVLFPFGHGLSYTTFEIGTPRLSAESMKDTDTVTVTVPVTNTGKAAGKEVVQLYVHDSTGTEVRPEKELKGFAKVALAPGETKEVTMTLDKRSFAYYNTQIHDWYAPTGEYDILVGDSSRNITGSVKIHVESTSRIPFTVTPCTTIGELMKYPELTDTIKEKMMPHLGAFMPDESTAAADASETKEMAEAVIRYMPIRALRSFGTMTNAEMNEICRACNDALKN